MQRPRQQRALHAAPRRSPATRRRPEWNGYLTDADRYKLSQQQQLQRQLQQLSTAHFVSRSPRQAASAARRVEQRAALTPRTATPRTPLGRGVSGLGERSSSGRTARRLQFADEALSPESRRSRVDSPASFVSEEPTPRRRMGVEEKASLQNELALLERMLWDLEVETERLGLKQAESDADQDAEDNLRDSEPLSYGEEDDEEDQHSEQGDGDDRGEAGQRDRDSIGDAAGDDRGERARLEEVCHKSLAVSMSLAQKVNQLAKQLEDERRLRHEHEMRVDVLERELRATQAKCGYLEAKCDGMNSQLEEMHEAVMSTDDAIHRMAQAFDRTRFSSARSPAPSTPHRQGYSTPSRKTPAKSALKQTPRPSTSSTPSRNDGREDDEPTQLENLPPNRPH